VSKHIDGKKPEQDNLVLKEAGAHLRKKRDGLQARHDKQLPYDSRQIKLILIYLRHGATTIQ
jgi:hypothetical protein